MTAEKPSTTGTPVTFADVRVGDVLSFSTADNGFGGTGGYITRTGAVTSKTAKTVTIKVDDPAPVRVFAHGRDRVYGLTARLRAADWYHRQVRRIPAETPTRTPYDADHVAIVDDGTTVTAVWCADPAANPRALLAAPPFSVPTGEYEVVAEAKRHYRRDGAGFSGWIVRSRSEHGTEPLPNKAAAMAALRLAVAAYFNR